MLSPTEQEAIRAETRRWVEEARIRDEEWARAQGFPYWPRWALPAVVLAAAIVAFLAGFFPAYFLAQQPRTVVVHVVQQPRNSG